MKLTRLIAVPLALAIVLNLAVQSKAQTFEPYGKGEPQDTVGSSTRNYDPPSGIGTPDKTDGAGAR
jgi:hypothetical protein